MLATNSGTVVDVFKQVVLSNVLSLQRPTEYWESHAQVALAPADPGDGHGMGHLVRVGGKNISLARGALYTLLEPLHERKELTHIPSTAWLAMRAVGKDARRFLFCSTDAASLQSIQAAQRALGVVETKVECIQEDGVALLRGAGMVLSDHWTASTLAFIDPSDVAMATDAGISPLELWCEIANRGIPAMIAFTFGDTNGRAAVHAQFAEAIRKSRLNGRSLYRFEGSLVQAPVTAPPISWGFGVMGANLAENAILSADRELFAMQSIYAGTILEGWGDGMWKYSGERC